MSWVAVAIGGGTAISAASGAIQGGAANRAGRQARDFADRDNLGGQADFGTQLYGSQYNYVPTLRRLLGEAQQRNDPAAAAQYARQIEAATQPTATSILGRMGAVGDNIVNQQGQDLARFDTDSARIEGLFGGARDTLGREAGRLNDLAAGGEQMATTDAARMNSMAGGAESIARQFGAGRDRLIRQDASRQQRAMDDTSRAQLAASGFGNTTAAGAAMRGNARAVGEQQDRALQNSQDSRLSALLGARSQRINTGQTGAGAVQAARGRRIGIGQDMAGSVYGADTNLASAVAGRLGQRTGLRTAHLANEQGLRMAPINTQLGVAQGSVLNPNLGANTAQYYPGASGAANALGSVGNTLTGLGGMGLAGAGTNSSSGASAGGMSGISLEELRRLLGG